jgi:two-component system cell cycle response regulator DivK
MKAIRTFLIIEDDPYNRELEKALFERSGYTVLEAEDAGKGIAIAEDEKPDLIVLDLHLPRINGLQALEHLKHNHKTRGIPCVFVTASATEDQIEQLKSSDACGYVTKPINTRTFVAQVIAFAKRPEVAKTHAQ